MTGRKLCIGHTGLVTTTLPLLLSGANRKCRPVVPLKESTTHAGLVVRLFPRGVRIAVTGTYRHMHTSHFCLQHVDNSGLCPQYVKIEHDVEH